MAKDCVVAAGHLMTAQAAESVLRSGGNAFDAAVAAMAAACVAEPVLASLGGGGFALACPARGTPRLLDFFVQTPSRRIPEHDLEFYPVLADFGNVTQEFHIGRGTIAVPGFVKGLFRLNEELGSMPMTELLRPAVDLARRGVVITDYHAYLFQVVSTIYTATAACAQQFASATGPGLVRGGERLLQPQLADSLEVLALEGERLFYEGEMSAVLAADLGQAGQFEREEMKAYRVLSREPLALDLRGARVLTNPPPSSGGVLTAFALGILDSPGLESLHRFDGEYLARVVETQAATSAQRLERVAAGLEPDRDMLDPELLQRYRRLVMRRATSYRGTTHISIIDAAGNLASVSLSNGEGSGYVLPGTGIVMNNMLGEEDLNPAGFQRFPLNQRMTSMMMPSAVAWADGTLAAAGSGGSNRIRSALLQVLSHLLVFGDDMESAVNAPRVHLEGKKLSVEGGFDPERIACVLEAYPDHHLWEGQSMFFGGVHAVRRGRRGSDGCGDPRREGVFLRCRAA